ncbi:MAG: hypothetical protein U0401_09155 [Anaerolineae bacterium]
MRTSTEFLTQSGELVGVKGEQDKFYRDVFTLILVGLASLGLMLFLPFDPADLSTHQNLPAKHILTIPAPSNLGQLAYLQAGDIWVKELPNGQPRQLTRGGDNRRPRWSSSGKWLAYWQGEKEGSLWLVAAEGSPLYRLDNTRQDDAFAWAPTSDRLAYLAGGSLRLADLNQATPITTTLVAAQLARGYAGYHLAWRPDESVIAYEWFTPQFGIPLTYQGLWQVDLADSQRLELYQSGAPEKGTADLAGWTADGSFLLFWQGDYLANFPDGAPLYALPMAGGSPRLLAEEMLEYGDFVVPAPFLANTAKLEPALAFIEGGYRAAWMNKRLVVNGEARTNSTVAVTSPSWSPDETRLAYSAMPDRGDLVGGEEARLGLLDRRLWLVSTDNGSQPRQLTAGSAYRDEYPLWSANGDTLLFARFDRQDRASLWLMEVAGSEPQQVVANLPLLELASDWFGYFGHVEWNLVFDWWRGPAPPLPLIADGHRATPGTTAPSPMPTATPTVSTTLIDLHALVLYAQGGALRSFPGYTDFIRPELQHLYDLLLDEGGPGFYLTAYRPLPSPNGRYLLVHSPAPSGSGQSWLADLTTGQLQPVMSSQVAATFSPDSRHLTFVQGGALFTAPVTDPQQLAPLFQPGLIDLFARWSPTGEWIAVALDTQPEDQTRAERSWAYWLVSPHGKELKYLGEFPVQPFGMIPQNMDWSPDGQWLLTPSQVLLNLAGQSRPVADWLADPSGWLPPVLAQSALRGKGTEASVTFPSPSGRQIVYLITDVAARQNDIYLFDRSSQTHTLLGSGIFGDYFASDIRWDPHEHFLVIGTERPGVVKPSGGPIFILKPEPGSTPQLLLDAPNLHLVEVLGEP